MVVSGKITSTHCDIVCAQSLQLSDSAVLWTVAQQTPLSQDFLGKNTRVDCHAILQGKFPNQGSNHLLLWQANSLLMNHRRDHAPYYNSLVLTESLKHSVSAFVLLLS